MVVFEGCCEVDRVVTPAFRFGGGWDGTKTTFGMKRTADMEDDKSARADRSKHKEVVILGVMLTRETRRVRGNVCGLRVGQEVGNRVGWRKISIKGRRRGGVKQK